MADPIKRLNYFNGQFLREPDFNDEQHYHVRHQRDHARLMHTAGIAEGLQVPDPAAGASAVTVNAGVAYDEQGRRIALPNNLTVELAALPAGQAAYVTIAYAEAQTDPTDETGITGNRRWTETPLIEVAAVAPASPTLKLVLARVLRTGTVVSSIDRSERLVAGAKGGDLAVRSLTLSSEAVAPAGWVRAQLASSGRASLGGSLQVTGDLVVSGAIQGNIAVNTIETGDLIDGAVTLAKLAPNSVDGSKIVDGSVGTAELANGAVTLQKMANASVDANKLVDGNVSTAKLADGAVTLQKMANASVDVNKLVDGNVSTAKLADGAVTLQKLAPGSVDATRIVDGSVGTAELANASVTQQKLAPALQSFFNSPRYSISGNLNTTSISASTTPQKIDNFLTFTKISPDSTLEVHLNSRASPGVFNGANGVIFRVRINDASPQTGVENHATITASNTIDFISIFAMFPGLPAGIHVVSVWATTNAGLSTGVILDPGGWGGRIIVRESL